MLFAQHTWLAMQIVVQSRYSRGLEKSKNMYKDAHKANPDQHTAHYYSHELHRAFFGDDAAAMNVRTCPISSSRDINDVTS